MPQPVNPKASSHAQALLTFLDSIQGKYLLSGQHDFIGSGDKYARLVREITGKFPIVWGSDFSFEYDGNEPRKIRHCGPANLSEPGVDETFLDVSLDQMRDALIVRVKEMHERGHIITLMWHHPFPTFGNRGPYESIWSFDARPDMESWRELTTPGTSLYRAWADQADEVAEYLKQLQQLNIPVLWRPYHEMNGVWFWWCKKPGAEGFQKLYRQLYERFTGHHELNNLLWVWNPNAPRDTPNDEAFAYADYYPGGDCVDVLAADVYREDWRQSHHDDILELADGKPISIGETAQLPTGEILDKQNYWTWFMPWGNLLLRNPKEHIAHIYKRKNVLTLEDIERDASGAFHIG